MPTRVFVLLFTPLLPLLLLGLPGAAAADPRDDRIEALERRVEELEGRLAQVLDRESAAEEKAPERKPQGAAAFADLYDGLDVLPDWIARVKLGGSANVGYFDGGPDNPLHRVDFAAWDARFFVDAKLGEEVLLGDHLVFYDASFHFEWDLVRLGELENDVGDLFVDLQGLFGKSWLNAQVGRFQVPVGEAYLRYGRGYAGKPFVTNTFGPWFWDEGIKLYGSDVENRYGYVASVSDGDTSFADDDASDKQVTLKLFANPKPWLHVSVSGARSGRLGSSHSNAGSALWLGETWARTYGAGTSVANYVDGAAVPDGPMVLRDVYYAGADVILKRESWGSLWLGYGHLWIDSRNDGGLYDRQLHYWIAELILEGERLDPLFTPFYLGVRAQGIGSYDDDRGYMLDSRFNDTLGYNMESMQAYSIVLGWRLTDWLRMRLEYTHLDLDLVRGLPTSIRRSGDSTDSGALELGVHF